MEVWPCSPHALQLAGFRRDKGLSLLALPLVAAVIFLSPAPSVPLWAVKTQLLASPRAWVNGPGALGAGKADAGWDGASFAGKLLKPARGEGVGMQVAPFGKPDGAGLGANAYFNVIAAWCYLISPKLYRRSKQRMRGRATPTSSALVCTGQLRGDRDSGCRYLLQ